MNPTFNLIMAKYDKMTTDWLRNSWPIDTNRHFESTEHSNGIVRVCPEPKKVGSQESTLEFLIILFMNARPLAFPPIEPSPIREKI